MGQDAQLATAGGLMRGSSAHLADGFQRHLEGALNDPPSFGEMPTTSVRRLMGLVLCSLVQ